MANLQILCDMGYERGHAAIALVMTENLSEAVEWLLTHPEDGSSDTQVKHALPLPPPSDTKHALPLPPPSDTKHEQGDSSRAMKTSMGPSAYNNQISEKHQYDGAKQQHAYGSNEAGPSQVFAPPSGEPPRKYSYFRSDEDASRDFDSSRHAPEDVEVSGMRKMFSKLGGDGRPKAERHHERLIAHDEMTKYRWGPPNGPNGQMITRYWNSTRMRHHWEYLYREQPNDFKRKLVQGYMEPIPTAWVHDRRLAMMYPENSLYETPAEERLYYYLNNGRMPDGSQHAKLRPLNINRDRYQIIRRGNERNARQVNLDPQMLAAYRSPHDIFQSDREIKSRDYSQQVPNVVYAARTAALHELADGIVHGTDHLETMILIDVSGSMTWNPHHGVTGPDGMIRYHDQPSNIALVEHLVHRVLHHMIPRAQKEHPTQRGIDAVTFSSYGRYIGQLSARNFKSDWRSKVQLGGATQVMQGWQVVKNTYFEHQHRQYGHGRYDPVFGWQPTPQMPKLSLLVFLDGECQDMDEFELELMGETWAYVTIALVGMENCPHHHSHAIELERVCRFNPHIGFFDVHGRVCERMVVQDILGSVYPVDPPVYEEVLKPEYDLPDEPLPAYAV